jgi:hypothetical protein
VVTVEQEPVTEIIDRCQRAVMRAGVGWRASPDGRAHRVADTSARDATHGSERGHSADGPGLGGAGQASGSVTTPHQGME